MRRRNRRVAWLILLVSVLVVPPSVVMAQDFTTGAVVGTILADDGGEKQEEQRPSVSPGDPLEPMAAFMLSIMNSTFMKIIAMLMLVLGIANGIMRQSIGSLVFAGAITMMIYSAPVVFEAILRVDLASTGGATTQMPGEPNDDGAPVFWIIIALTIPPIALSMYRAWKGRRHDELDELIRDYTARQAGETPKRPSDEPASLDELGQRQRDNEQANEPLVVSTASSAPKVEKEEEPLELQPGKRKIILD